MGARAYVKLLFKTRVLGIPATLSSSAAGFFSAGPPLAHIDPAALAALYAGVLMAHLSVDAFDDYFDFKKGLAQLKARGMKRDLLKRRQGDGRDRLERARQPSRSWRRALRHRRDWGNRDAGQEGAARDPHC